MHQHLSSDFKLQEILEYVKLSQSYFIRLFKKETELPPHQYFNKLKIETASYILTHQDLSLAKIAESLNFYDEYHFSRVFKQFKGIPPGKYRRKYKN